MLNYVEAGVFKRGAFIKLIGGGCENFDSGAGCLEVVDKLAGRFVYFRLFYLLWWFLLFLGSHVDFHGAYTNEHYRNRKCQEGNHIDGRCRDSHSQHDLVDRVCRIRAIADYDPGRHQLRRRWRSFRLTVRLVREH